MKNVAEKLSSFIVVLAGIAILARILIYIFIQFPSPGGDGISFASVASYHCKEGSFVTPIFPLDPSGEFRYVWHAIGHPALISFLNFNCTNFGSYFALSLIIILTFSASYFFTRKIAGAPLSVLFALIVFALQVKQGFRPETTAILVSLFAEYYRSKEKSFVWIQFALLLAWVQPTTFIIYGFYILFTNNSMQWRNLFNGYHKWLPVALLVNGLIIYLYPFKINDLIEGLILQGRMFFERSDGDIATYYVISHFFPLFGVVFFLAYSFQVLRNKFLVLMVPVIWFYGLRVPPTYYNIVPLFVVIIYNLLISANNSNESSPQSQSIKLPIMALVGLTGFLAFMGILQGNLRDINSFVRYRSTLDNSITIYQEIEKEGNTPCKVPPFFTLFLPSGFFDPSYESKSKICEKIFDHKKVDIVAASGRGGMLPDHACKPWPLDKGANFLSKIFKSDSGYSFYVCDIK